MEGNFTSNETGIHSSMSVDFGDLPGFVAYNVIMLVLIVIPITILDALLVVTLFLDKVSPVQVKTVIINLLLGALCVSFALVLEHLAALILSTTDHPVPSVDFCHFIIWVLAGGGASRMAFTALFSILVFILVKSSAKAVKEKFLIVWCVVLWLAVFVISAPLLSAFVAGTQFFGKTACIPLNTEISHPFAYLIYVPMWTIICGLVPLGITVAMPLATIYYLKTQRVIGDIEFKKAMAKLSFFLLIGILIGFAGQVVPPILTVSLFVDSPLVVYLAFILMNLSLIPTPILILIYLSGVRQKLKEILLCYCIRYPNKSSRLNLKNSRSASVGSTSRRNTALSNVTTFSRQNTGLSEVTLFRQNTGLSEVPLSRQSTNLTIGDLPSSKPTVGIIVDCIPEENEQVDEIIPRTPSSITGFSEDRLQNQEIGLTVTEPSTRCTLDTDCASKPHDAIDHSEINQGTLCEIVRLSDDHLPHQEIGLVGEASSNLLAPCKHNTDPEDIGSNSVGNNSIGSCESHTHNETNETTSQVNSSKVMDKE